LHWCIVSQGQQSLLQQMYVGLIKAQGAEKRGFSFPNCMGFREQVSTQFFGRNVRVEVIGKLHRCFYAFPNFIKKITDRMPNATRPELLLEAGARHERTLLAVSSRPVILIEAPPQQTDMVC
jgi:hypothetical protein